MKNSKIEWTDHTFNAWIGCTKVSPGCANCYAESLDKRWGHDSWGLGQPRRRTSEAYWRQPLAWNKAAEKAYLSLAHSTAAGTPVPFTRPRVFCASLADWLDDEVPIDWLGDLLFLILQTPYLDWLLLTKRPHLWRSRIEAAYKLTFDERRPWLDLAAWLDGTPPANVWIGTTVEDQARADERIPHLLRIPARVRFLSCEPLLGPVELGGWFTTGGCGYLAPNSPQFYGMRQIDWVICGGESGAKARLMHPDWARSLRDQCAWVKVPFFFKQWGEHNQDGNRVGKHAAGSLIDGKEYKEFPA